MDGSKTAKDDVEGAGVSPWLGPKRGGGYAKTFGMEVCYKDGMIFDIRIRVVIQHDCGQAEIQPHCPS